MHFQNILFATDFSSTANLALPYAVEIARRSGGTIHAVHVISPEIDPLVPPEAWSQIDREEQDFRGHELRKLEAELQGLPHEFLLLKGNVWENLSRTIKEKQIDLLVLGTHGRTGIERAILGSAAERIFRQATCPVLSVGPHVSVRATHAAAAELNCILYATDFSPESFAAARHAIYLAKDHHADLVLFHSMESADGGDDYSSLETLREIVPLGTKLASDPKCVVTRGEAADSILGIAAKDHADLIVLGIRGADGHLAAASHFAKSITYKVITQSTCPVLTVRG